MFKQLIIKLKLNRLYKASLKANEKVLGRPLSDGEKEQLRFACAMRLYNEYNTPIKRLSGEIVKVVDTIDEWVDHDPTWKTMERDNNVG